MALHLCLRNDCTSIVSDTNPLSTKHTNLGEAQTIVCYIFNDGLRTGIENDTSGMELIYTNIGIFAEGYSHTITGALSPSTSSSTVLLDSTDGWGIGTICKSGMERMRVEEIISATSVRVTRNYTADGGTSAISTHTVGSILIPETTNISFAPASVDNTANAGTFLNGGESISLFLAPTYLQSAVTSAEISNTIITSDGSQYATGDIIQINGEQMKITNANGNTLTVQRGYNSTMRSQHQQRDVIYLIGMTQTYKAYPFFIKNDPPSGLPTQKKYDVKIKISTDEEPL